MAGGPESLEAFSFICLVGDAGCQPGCQQELLHVVSLHGLIWASSQHGGGVQG